MDDRLSRLEGRVEELARALAGLELRMARVEGQSPSQTAPTRESELPAPSEAQLPVALSRAGVTFLALGGAYLLRALTEAGTLPQVPGVFLGAAYACAWVLLAHRAGRKGDSTLAAFHGGAAVLVGYPLVWETTVRLGFLPPAASALAILAFSVALFAVVWRWRLLSTAWVTQIAATLTAFALMAGTRTVLPYAALLVALGLSTLWLAHQRDWLPLAWVSAGVADLAVFLLIAGFLIQGTPSGTPALSVPLFLFIGYLFCFYRRKTAGPFEMIQGPAATLAGYGGAVLIADGASALSITIVAGIGAAVACYAAALGSAEGKRKEVLFGSLALGIGLLSTARLPGREYVLLVLALLAFELGRRTDRLLLGLHGGITLVAAAAVSGLFLQSANAFLLHAPPPWRGLSLPALLVLATAIAAARAKMPARDHWGGGVPRLLALAVAAAGVGVVAMHWLVPFVPQTTDGSIERGALAASRSAVLAATAIGLGALAGRGHVREAVWVLYPLLVLSGIKLVVEDFAHGRAATLFVGLLCYGSALILASRLARGSR